MITDIGNIGTVFADVLGKAAEKNQKLVERTMRKAPNDFQRAAIRFYPKVLKRRSGNLVRSIQGFYSQDMASREYNVGVRAGGEVAKYAPIQHEGGYIRPHIIRPRVAKVLAWGHVLTASGRKARGRLKVPNARGAKSFYKYSNFAMYVRHPGCYIKPKKYLWYPMRTETERITKELLVKISL